MDQDSLKESVDRIKVKAGMLLSRYQAVRENLSDALERIAVLEEDLRLKERQLAALEQEITTMKMAVVLTPDHREVEATRVHLSGLV